MSAASASRATVGGLTDGLVALVLFALALGYFSLTFNRTLELRDEGQILHQAERVAAGAVPHRDFTDFYGPGVFAVVGAVLRLFDGRVIAVRALLVLVKAAAVVATFAVVRLAAPWPFAAFGAIFGLAYWGRWSWNLNTPYAALLTIPLCMVATGLLAGALSRGSRGRYFLAGLAGGGAVVFKQSLGIPHAGALLLAVVAATTLETPDGGRPPASRVVRRLCFWLLAAVGTVLPFARFLTLGDYLVNVAPIHLLLAIVAFASVRRGAVDASVLRSRLVPLALGLAVVPALTILAYAALGGLEELVYDMAVLPGLVTNYSLPLPSPPAGLVAAALAVLGMVWCSLLLLSGRRGRAVAAAAGALLVGAAGYLGFPEGPVQTVHYADPGAVRNVFDGFLLWRAWDFLEAAQPLAILLAAAATVARSLRDTDVDPAVRRVILPLALSQAMLGFQVFPRAGYGLWILQGALGPLVGVLTHRAYRVGVASGGGWARQSAAALLAVLVPLWMIVPAFHTTFWTRRLVGAGRGLESPALAGIRLSEPEIGWAHLDDLEALVRWLRERPAGAPVLLLTNDYLPLFLSGRAEAAPREAYDLVLHGWGLAPDRVRRPPPERAVISSLERSPSAIIVERPGECAARIRAAMPALGRWVDERYEVVATFGFYRVLLRRNGDPPGLDFRGARG